MDFLTKNIKSLRTITVYAELSSIILPSQNCEVNALDLALEKFKKLNNNTYSITEII